MRPFVLFLLLISSMASPAFAQSINSKLIQEKLLKTHLVKGAIADVEQDKMKCKIEDFKAGEVKINENYRPVQFKQEISCTTNRPDGTESIESSVRITVEGTVYQDNTPTIEKVILTYAG